MQTQEHYVKIPKDLSLIKSKFMFGLTKRQVICFAIGLGAGFPIFFLFKTLTDNLTVAVFAMGIAAAPAIMAGLLQQARHVF